MSSGFFNEPKEKEKDPIVFLSVSFGFFWLLFLGWVFFMPCPEGPGKPSSAMSAPGIVSAEPKETGGAREKGLVRARGLSIAEETSLLGLQLGLIVGALVLSRVLLLGVLLLVALGLPLPV